MLTFSCVLCNLIVFFSFSDVDEYGFERPEDFDYESYEEFMSSYLKTLAKRSKKWSEYLDNGKNIKKNVKLKRYVRKGIPAEYRGFVSILMISKSVSTFLLRFEDLQSIN